MRGEGTTTKQIQEAPQGAVFVWCNNHLDYPKNLAKRLKRNDLRVISPEQIRTLRGIHCPVVIDHACAGFEREQALIVELCCR